MIESEKLELINEIKMLIDNNGKETQINLKYIEFFEVEELLEIKEGLLSKKNHREDKTSDFLDDIFNKCS